MNFISPLMFIANNLVQLTIGIFSIGFLIGFHELGHFLFCKLFQVHTPSFSIGFGPTLISRRIGDTDFKLSAIPLGGYVEIAGMAETGQGDQKDALRADAHSFLAKPWYQKFLIMFGGIFFNLIFAYTVFILTFAIKVPTSNGFYPFNAQTVIASIEDDSVARTAGLAIDDKIVAIDQKPIVDSMMLIDQIRNNPNKAVSLTVERTAALREIPVTIGTKMVGGSSVGSLGIRLAPLEGTHFTVWQAVRYGILCTNAYIKMTVAGFATMFSAQGHASAVGGPLKLIAATSHAAGQGFEILLFIMALISINLAVLNLLPLPILDGGQILFYTIEAIIGKPLPNRVREYIHIASWLLVMGLILLISVKDVFEIVRPYGIQIKDFITK